MEEESQIQSLTNEGNLLQQRIDYFNKLINHSKLILYSFVEEHLNMGRQTFYFQEVINQIYEKSIILSGYYDSKEEKKCGQMKDYLNDLIINKHPLFQITNQGWGGKIMVNWKFNPTNKREFEKKLDIFDKYVSGLFVKYELSGLKKSLKPRGEV